MLFIREKTRIICDTTETWNKIIKQDDISFLILLFISYIKFEAKWG